MKNKTFFTILTMVLFIATIMAHEIYPILNKLPFFLGCLIFDSIFILAIWSACKMQKQRTLGTRATEDELSHNTPFIITKRFDDMFTCWIHHYDIEKKCTIGSVLIVFGAFDRLPEQSVFMLVKAPRIKTGENQWSVPRLNEVDNCHLIAV